SQGRILVGGHFRKTQARESRLVKAPTKQVGANYISVSGDGKPFDLFVIGFMVQSFMCSNSNTKKYVVLPQELVEKTKQRVDLWILRKEITRQWQGVEAIDEIRSQRKK
ncbi:MAG: hypothetical protein G01um101470_769, partial [Parcubacteria group bacterium Gr01-1014_70]